MRIERFTCVRRVTAAVSFMETALSRDRCSCFCSAAQQAGADKAKQQAAQQAAERARQQQLAQERMQSNPNARPPSGAPPVNQPASANNGPVHVAENLEAAKLISQPKLNYPPNAKAAHIQGTVRVRALIGTDENQSLVF